MLKAGRQYLHYVQQHSAILYRLGRVLTGRFSFALVSTMPMNSATDTPKAGASLKMVLTLALFLPSSSNEM